MKHLKTLSVVKADAKGETSSGNFLDDIVCALIPSKDKCNNTA